LNVDFLDLEFIHESGLYITVYFLSLFSFQIAVFFLAWNKWQLHKNASKV